MNDEDFNQNEFDAVVQNLEQESKVPAQAPVDDDLPDKLRGKTAKEIAQMYLDAEKLIGRQAQEVGEVRKLADELIRSKMQPAQPVQQAAASEDIDEVDFFANPKEAVSKLVANHPAVKQAQAVTAKLGQTEAKRAVLGKHPDAMEIVQSPEFQAFVDATPVRQKLFMAAHQAYNYEAADELLTTFKELKATRQVEQVNQFQERNKQAIKDAAVSVGGSGEVGKKVYRRADLIRLQIQDPHRYEQLQPEIMAAYSEGRVK